MKVSTVHIGLIGGIGPAATIHYYRLLAAQFKQLELTIAHANMEKLISNFGVQDQETQAAIFADHVGSLKHAGAGLAAVTSITGHYCFDALHKRSALPLVSILDSLRAHFASNGIERIGILGSQSVMQSHLFGLSNTVTFVTPSQSVLAQVGDTYMEMARSGRCEEHQRQLFFSAGDEMVKSGGVDAILLGGTDLFLAFGDEDPGYAVIDAAKVHVADIARTAGYQ